MKIKHYLWVFSIIGGMIAFISVLLPTTFNDTTPTLYFVWFTQIAVNIEPLEIYLLRTEVILVLVSWILMLIIVVCSILTVTLTIGYIRASLSHKTFKWMSLIGAVLNIASPLFWIFMIESFYNEAGYNHWVLTGGGYTPFLGIIFPFIAAGLILLGSFSIKRES